MKKLLGLCLSLWITATILSGCGASPSGSGSIAETSDRQSVEASNQKSTEAGNQQSAENAKNTIQITIDYNDFTGG